MPSILLVEDDPDVLFVIQHALLGAGHKIETASTMTAGLELLQPSAYDLVICDGKLPDGTGLDVADRAVEQGIKALVMTATRSLCRLVRLIGTKFCSSRCARRKSLLLLSAR